MKLTTNDVRYLAHILLSDGTESISVWELCKMLEDEGYRVHFTFCIGACVSKDSGLYVMNNRIYKIPTKIKKLHHLELKKYG